MYLAVRMNEEQINVFVPQQHTYLPISLVKFRPPLVGFEQDRTVPIPLIR